MGSKQYKVQKKEKMEGYGICKDIFISLENHFMIWLGKAVGFTKSISCFKVRTSYFALL